MALNRSDTILKYIVEYFIKKAQPVGSHTLIEEYKLPYSSATIRNEMFARAGHQFDPIGSYYRHFSSYDWYEPTGTITMGDLADKWPITSSNTSTIKYLENLIKEG